MHYYWELRRLKNEKPNANRQKTVSGNFIKTNSIKPIKNMIGVNPTKVQLTNEDLSEYEAKKQTWKRVQPSTKGLENNSQKQQSDTYRRKEVQSRIGIKK